MADCERDRPRHRATRRQIIVGGAALAAASTTAGRAFPEIAHVDRAGPVPGSDEAILDLERQLHAASAEWDRAADAFAEAEEALFALLKDADADAAAEEAARARYAIADADADRLGEAVDDLAIEICSMPAESLTGLACKARVTLRLGMDGLAESVLRDLVRFAGDGRG